MTDTDQVEFLKRFIELDPGVDDSYTAKTLEVIDRFRSAIGRGDR